jgi:hypothetical protein
MSDAHHQRPSASAAVARQARPGPLQRYLPILQWLPHYQPKWLAADVAAALSVWGALLVPQGLAYATVAEVPVRTGSTPPVRGRLPTRSSAPRGR